MVCVIYCSLQLGESLQAEVSVVVRVIVAGVYFSLERERK